MRYFLLTIACFVLIQSIAQKEKKHYYSKEFSVLTENDAYMLKHKDGYYTAGLFLQLNKASEKDNHKIITRYELGQTMFTTGDRRAVLRGEEDIDRPYAGYLYAKYARDKFISSNEIFSWNASVGVTGRLSLAQQLQDAYHKLIHLYYYPYWEKQMPNAIGANAGINYKNTLAGSSLFKVVYTAEANAGMFYTNAKVGAYFCVGNFENNNNSALFNARISSRETSTKRKYELFVYCYPQVIFQGYNATLQGTLFYKTGNAVASKPNTLVYQQTFGIAYSKPRWTARVETNFQTKETPLQIRQQRYGGIQFAYRFN